jgi:hypothetical protein
VVHRRGRAGANLTAVKAALPYGLESLFYYLLPTFARMVNISEKVQSTYSLIGKYKYRIYKFIVFKGGRPCTIKHQLTVLKSTVVKAFAGQINTLVTESL